MIQTSRSKKYFGIHQRFAAILFFLTRSPRTVPELIELLGMPMYHASGTRNSQSHATVSKFLRSMEEEGLVQRVGFRIDPLRGKRGRRPEIWAWTGPSMESQNGC